jgi:CYTH domain-containing protein
VIENELKYVLTDNFPDLYFDKFCGPPVSINQGYLPGKARIRSKTSTKGVTHFFTYKLPVGDVLFEIEKKITPHEFEMLWPHTERRLTKLRYVRFEGSVQWDIDLFFDHGHQYFVMAEAEMPETMREPPSIPDFLKLVLLYAVPRERTKEFTSNRISNPEYAQTLMDTLRE